MNDVNTTAIAEAVAKALANMKAPKQGNKQPKQAKQKGRAKLTDAQKVEFIAKNDAECIKKFTKAGFKDVQPRVNVLTFKRWVELGRVVKKGEKSTKVGPFRLFHLAQTEA